jgi:hypothetical protein
MTELQRTQICATSIPEDAPSVSSNDFAVFMTRLIWPLNTVQKIAFLNSPEDGNVAMQIASNDDSKKDQLQIKYEEQAKKGTLNIKEAIKEIVTQRYTPILDRLKLEFVDNPNDASIRIKFDSTKGSWSKVGSDALSVSDKTEPTMNFGWFNTSTVLHEFGHAIGLVHEHQNPKGNAIEWNKPKLYAWATSTQGWDKSQTNKQIIQRYSENELNGSSYDPSSIMLYFYPSKLTTDNQGTSQNLTLSDADIQVIKKIYGKDSTDEQNTGTKPLSSPSPSSSSSSYLYIAAALAIALSIGIGIYLGRSRLKKKKRK